MEKLEEDTQMNADENINQNNAATTQNATATKVQELFGGAFRIEKFPETLRDISDIVPISDNQEIFSDVNESNPAYSGNQLIVEILQKLEKADPEAISFAFHDLGQESNAKDITELSVQHFISPAEIESVMPTLSALTGCTSSVHLLTGTQKIVPNKKPYGERDFVTMLMCLVRLDSPYDTDLLFTFNVPDKHTDEEEDKCELGQSDAYREFLAQAEADFKMMLTSFLISGDQTVKDLLGMD